MHHGPSRPDEIALPTLRELVAPPFRYWRTTVAIFAVTTAVTVMVAAIIRPSYEARMRILVNRERLDPVVTSDAQPGTVAHQEVTETDVYSEIALLTSRDLLEQVATAAGLVADRDESGAPAAQSPEARLARAVQKLSEDIEAEPVRRTTMIEVRYAAADPQLAARVLDLLARQFLEKHLAVHRPPGARQFFTEQSERLYAELKAAETRLNEFTAREHVVSASGERESTLQKLADFDSVLQETEAAIADAGNRLATIERQLTTTPARHVTQIRDGGNVETLRTMKAQLLQLEMKRSELQQKFTPQYPPLVQVERDILQLQAAVAEAEQTPLRDQTTDQNPTYQWLLDERARVRTEHDALQARAAVTRRTVAAYRARAARLDAQSLEQDELRRQVKTAEEKYALYQRKEEEARISDELDRTRIANVAVAEPPGVPQTARSPRRLIVLAGVGMALVLSVGASWLLYLLSPYFRTPDEVSRVLDIPVLASLPAAGD